MTSEKHSSALQLADLPDTARSDRSPDVVNAFEIPALKASTSHSRVAGYWDIRWLAQARAGIENFIESGNKMQLLIGIPIAKSLEKLINAEESTREGNAGHLLLDELGNSPDLSQLDIFKLLEWMLVQGSIEIRILLVGHSDRTPIPEHAKIQIYSDGQSKVASSGSKNDTRRGNSDGVDFIVICKSWSSKDSVSQIEGMEEYFRDHWNHADTVHLRDIKDNPDFMEKLQKLADDEQTGITPQMKFLRDIGKLNIDNCKGLIIQSKQNHYPSDLAKSNSEIDIITSEEPINKWHIDTLERYVTSVQAVFMLPGEGSEVIVSNYDNEYLAFCWKQESRFNFSVFHQEASTTSVNKAKDELDELVLDFFGIEVVPAAVEVETEIASPGKGATRKPTHLLVPEMIVNYPWGESLRPHHIRSLNGDVGSGVIDTEKAITGGFLQTKSGLFEHATGSGKTGLGLIAAAHMLSDKEIDFVVVVAPRIAIANQWWLQSLDWFNMKDSVQPSLIPLRSYSDSKGIPKELQGLFKQTKIDPDDWPNELVRDDNGRILVTVDKTFFDNIERIVECQNDGLKWGLIIDEAHRLVTNDDSKIDQLNLLNPEYKLALTAKFEHPKNGEGSQAVLDWLTTESNHIDKFPLSSALKMEYLKPYLFNIHLLDADNDDKLKKLSQEYVVKHFGELEHGPTLLYVNENTVIGLNLLKNELKARGHNPETFTYDHQEKKYLDLWAEGVYNPMMSLTILDEGVDVPACSSAILLDCSEEDDRQWIQRRGRTLRIDPKEPDSHSVIHDFAPEYNHAVEWSISWWEHNIQRILEFNKDARGSEIHNNEGETISNELAEFILGISKDISGE